MSIFIDFQNEMQLSGTYSNGTDVSLIIIKNTNQIKYLLFTMYFCCKKIKMKEEEEGRI